MARDPAALQLRLLQTVVEVAAEKNSTLVMPVPVELLRFFDKFTPPGAAGEQKSAADSASLADFGNEDVEKVEAEIEGGAPLEIPDVPDIPAIPAEVGDGKRALGAAGGKLADETDVSADEIDAAAIPKRDKAAGGGAAGGGAAGGGAAADSGA